MEALLVGLATSPDLNDRQIIYVVSSLFVSALLLCVFVVTPLMIKASVKFRVLDKPDSTHKSHVGEIPYLGGVGIFVAAAVVLIPLGFTFPNSPLLEILKFAVGPILILLVLGLVDDLYKLSALTRLGVQCLVSVFLVLQLNQTVYAPEFFSISWLDFVAATFWLIWFSNLLNMFDNHDGAASGVSLIVFLLIASLAYRDGSTAILLLSTAIAGAIGGFMRFNWPPAKIYLGDSGAIFISYTAGIFFLLMDYDTEIKIGTFAIPLLGVAILVLDFILVVSSRIKRGVSPLIGDKSHSSHRLVMIGLSKSKVSILLILLSIGFAVLAFLLGAPESGPAIEGALLALGIVLSTVYLSILSKMSF